MKQHIELLALIYLFLGMLGAVAGFVVFAATIGAGLISRDQQALAILSMVGISVTSFLFLISLPGVLAGIGL